MKENWYENIVVMIVGGNGKDRYRDGDIVCKIDGYNEYKYELVSVEKSPLVPLYRMPDDICDMTADFLQATISEHERKKSRSFENIYRIRLVSAGTSKPEVSFGDAKEPLILTIGLTQRHSTCCTNNYLKNYPARKLPCGRSIEEKYAGDPVLWESQLSDSLSLNLSIITTIDKKIHIGKRSKHNAFNPDVIFQPIVSGGSFGTESLFVKGRYDPFETAIRKIQSEVADVKIDRKDITFFGVAKRVKGRYPFLYGEARLQMDSETFRSLAEFRNDNAVVEIVEPIPFTLEGVLGWVENHKAVPDLETTFFSLYMSLLYEYYDADIEQAAVIVRKFNSILSEYNSNILHSDHDSFAKKEQKKWTPEKKKNHGERGTKRKRAKKHSSIITARHLVILEYFRSMEIHTVEKLPTGDDLADMLKEKGGQIFLENREVFKTNGKPYFVRKGTLSIGKNSLSPKQEGGSANYFETIKKGYEILRERCLTEIKDLLDGIRGAMAEMGMAKENDSEPIRDVDKRLNQVLRLILSNQPVRTDFDKKVKKSLFEYFKHPIEVARNTMRLVRQIDKKLGEKTDTSSLWIMEKDEKGNGDDAGRGVFDQYKSGYRKITVNHLNSSLQNEETP